MSFPKLFYCTFADGEMAEWSIAAVLKTVECNSSRGSNPFLSASILSFLDWLYPVSLSCWVFFFMKKIVSLQNKISIGSSGGFNVTLLIVNYQF